jgi:hypothetical protein
MEKNKRKISLNKQNAITLYKDGVIFLKNGLIMKP